MPFTGVCHPIGLAVGCRGSLSFRPRTGAALPLGASASHDVSTETPVRARTLARGSSTVCQPGA